MGTDAITSQSGSAGSISSGTAGSQTSGSAGTSSPNEVSRGAGITNIQGAEDLYNRLSTSQQSHIAGLAQNANALWGQYNTAVHDQHSQSDINSLRSKLTEAEHNLVSEERSAFNTLGDADQAALSGKGGVGDQLHDAANKFNNSDPTALFQYSARPSETSGTQGVSGLGTLPASAVAQNINTQLNQGQGDRSPDQFGKDLKTWANGHYNGGSGDTQDLRDSDKAMLLKAAGSNPTLQSQINDAFSSLKPPPALNGVQSALTNHAGNAPALQQAINSYAASQGQSDPTKLTPEQKQALLNQVADKDKPAVNSFLNPPPGR